MRQDDDNEDDQRLIQPTSGKVFINGKDTSTIDPIKLRRTIGYVIQQIGLFPNKTIEENICVVPDLLGWVAANRAPAPKSSSSLSASSPTFSSSATRRNFRAASSSVSAFCARWRPIRLSC